MVLTQQLQEPEERGHADKLRTQPHTLTSHYTDDARLVRWLSRSPPPRSGGLVVCCCSNQRQLFLSVEKPNEGITHNCYNAQLIQNSEVLMAYSYSDLIYCTIHQVGLLMFATAPTQLSCAYLMSTFDMPHIIKCIGVAPLAKLKLTSISCYMCGQNS